MNKKKILSVILAVALIVSASSCASGNNTAATNGGDSGLAAPSVAKESIGGGSGSYGGASGSSGGSGGESAGHGTSSERPDSVSSGDKTKTEAAAAGDADSYAEAPAPSPSGERADEAPSAESTYAAETASYDGGDEDFAPTTTRAVFDEPSAAFDDAVGAAEGESAFMYDAADEKSLDSYDMADAEECVPDYDDSYLYQQARAGMLTGGEWRDNSNYMFWKSLFAQRSDWKDILSDWQIDTLSRVFVRVSGNGSPAAGLTVKLFSGSTELWTAVTDSRGEAFLFPGIFYGQKYTPDTVQVELANGKKITEKVPANYNESDSAIEINVSETDPMRKELDLMFMIDTTGSMGDELAFIQKELENVIERVSQQTRADIALSVNFYRDEGDDYVVRDFEFTKDINKAIKDLSVQRSSGGGDYPEAVTKALRNGISDHQWRNGSEKLMFLVLDAPPHQDDALKELADIIKSAAQKGIRIIPVASSGVDTDTEYLCRSMAIATGGTYTFLTDDSGIGYSHLEPTIGNYEVEKLNDMIVRIINDYFSAEPRQSGQQKPGPVSSIQPVPSDYIHTSFKTSDYYSGEGFYRTVYLDSDDSMGRFFEDYGYHAEIKKLAENIDWSKELIAINVVCLSSGSITLKGDFSVSIADGKAFFNYQLDTPEVGTCDMAALFMAAVIPIDKLGAVDTY